MIGHRGWVRVARHPDLAGRDLRVFLGLCSYCDRAGYIQVFQKDLAEELGMYEQHVSNAVTQLRKVGILLRDPHKKRRKGSLYIHPDYF